MPGSHKLDLSKNQILLLSSNPAETLVLELILSKHVVLKIVQNLSELQKVLEESSYDAALCGWSLQPGTWEKALKQVQQYNPDLPVIIFRQTGDERDWVKVLEAGAFDLLQAPYEERTIRAALEHAVASSEARRLRHIQQPVLQAIAS